MLRLTQLILALSLLTTVAQSGELTINPVPEPVGPHAALTGKAPNVDAKVFLIVNPLATPQQFWVQKMAKIVDGKKNWLCSIRVGNPGKEHVGQQFVVVAVANPIEPLREGDVLSDWPTAKWASQPVTLTRK